MMVLLLILSALAVLVSFPVCRSVRADPPAVWGIPSHANASNGREIECTCWQSLYLSKFDHRGARKGLERVAGPAAWICQWAFRHMSSCENRHLPYGHSKLAKMAQL